MAARDRVLKVGAPVKGLTDFPAQATPEHATQAYNVEYTLGGVASRRGSAQISADIYGAATAIVKLVRPMPSRNAIVVGLRSTSGANDGEQRLIVLAESTGDERLTSQLSAPALAPFHPTSYASRWDSCEVASQWFARRRLAVCTDSESPVAGSVYLSNGAFNDMTAVVGINRNVSPLHGNSNTSGVADDQGTYTTAAIRARFCRFNNGRLILGGVTATDFNQPSDSEPYIWYSNYLDPVGWPIENMRAPQGVDPSRVTGLGNFGHSTLVFRETTISRFQHRGRSDDLSFQEVSQERGCIAHSTIVEGVRGMTCFLASDGFYGYNGSGNLQYLSEQIESTLRPMLNNGFGGAAFATHYPVNRQVWLVMPTQGNQSPKRAFVWDYSYNAWSVFEWQTAAWGDGGVARRLGGMATNHDGTKMFGVAVSPGTKVAYYRYDVGNYADDQGSGAAIGYRSIYETGPIQYGNNRAMRWRYIRPLVRPTGNFNVTCTWRKDEQAWSPTTYNNQTNTYSANGRGTGLGSFVLGTDRLGFADDHSLRVDVHSGGVGRYGRVGFLTSGTVNEGMIVMGLEIDVLDREARR